MATEPDPQIVRELAREFMTNPNLTADDLDGVVRSHTGWSVPDEEFQDWRDAVRADADDAQTVTTVTWPDEQPAAECEDAIDMSALGRVLTDQEHDLLAIDGAIGNLKAMQKRGPVPVEAYNALCGLILRFGPRIEAMDADLERSKTEVV